MKILFICGSFESGKDGVGDYIRKISSELDSAIYQVHVLAINDTFAQSILLQTDTDNTQYPACLRIPSHLSPENRYKNALDYINSIQADCISLQFVPYAFHPKGLPYGMPTFLKSIPPTTFKHLMFHEIWIGISNDCPFKEKLVGYVQRRLIRKIISAFQATQLSCSNFMFHKLLERKGIDTDIIPLCSNVPLAPKNQVFLSSVLLQMGIKPDHRSEWKIMGLFGNLYSDSCIEQLIDQQLSTNNGSKRLALLSFGKLGDFSQNEWKRISEAYKDRVQFTAIGMLSEEEVSNVMQFIDIGICGTPSMYVAKSGALAAMKLHGLEVLFSDGLDDIDFLEDNKAYNKKFLNRPAEEWSPSFVAGMYHQLFQKKTLLNTSIH